MKPAPHFHLTVLLLALLHSPTLAAPYPATPATPTTKIEPTWTDPARNRPIPLLILYPQNLTHPAPIIIFSHGLGGTRYSYQAYGQLWASHGYIVLFPQHAGSDSAVIGHGMLPMLMGQNDVQPFIDRIADIHFLIDQLENIQIGKLPTQDLAPLDGKLDLADIGIAGHSFGAITAQAIAGEKYSLDKDNRMADPRVKAAVIMSGNGSREPNQDHAFASIHIPAFYLTGTADKIGLVDAAQRRIPFDHSTFPSTYLLTLDGATHMTFVPRTATEKYEPFITESTLAFWNAFLKHDPAAKTWLEKDFGTHLATTGTFEQKSHATIHDK